MPIHRLVLSVAVASAAAIGAVAAPVISGPGSSGPMSMGGAADAMSDPLDRIPPEVLAQLRGGASPALRQRGLELKRRLDAKPNDPFLMHALATVMYHEGNVAQAKAIWTASSQREPNLASAELMAALQTMFVQLASGRTAAARSELAAIEKRHASDPHFLLARAEQAMQGGNLRAAENDYRKAHDLAPGLWITGLNLARFLDRARNDTAGAGRLYQEVVALAPQRPEVWNHFAAYQLRQNQPEAALESLRKVKALDPLAALPERRLADLYRQSGQLEEAQRWYRSALAKRPPAEEELGIRVALGDVLVRLQRYDEARREMEAVLRVRPLPPVVFALGTLDEAEGKLDAAEKRYRQVLKQMPGNPLAANNLAMLLIKSGKGAAEALPLAEQARRALPNNAIVEGTWGCAMVEVRRSQAALPALQAAASAPGQTDPWTHYCLGRALVDQRRGAEATPHLEVVLKTDPGFPRKAEVVKLLATTR